MAGAPEYTCSQAVQALALPHGAVRATSSWTMPYILWPHVCMPVSNATPVSNAYTCLTPVGVYQPMVPSGWPVKQPSITAPQFEISLHSNTPDEFVRRDVWKLSQESRGCKFIQQTLEDADDSTRREIADELRSHVWEAIRSLHANYVIQKCISVLRPCDSQFIIDEILQQGPGAAVELAEHEYGCRILQRLLEHFPADRMSTLIDDILPEAARLCKNKYGSFVMQHLLEYGNEDQVSKLLQALTRNASSIASDPCGVSVLGQALSRTYGDAQEALANALASQPRWLALMSYLRHGYMAAKLTLQAAAPSQRKIALTEVSRHGHKMTSRYSKKLIAFVNREFQEQL